MTALERQHAAERAILGDGCPASLADFARAVLAAEWKYRAEASDVPAEAVLYLRKIGEMDPKPTAPKIKARFGGLNGGAM